MLPKINPSKKTIYLDYAATTPVDPRVKKAMEPFWSVRSGNPSSLYKRGREAHKAISQARKDIAAVLRARSAEIVFTAGGTESVNLAIFGVARAYELSHKSKGHILASAIEHHAVLHSLDALKEEGWRTGLIKVNEAGLIDLKKLKAAVRDDTVLISVMYANNEVGTIEPIGEIGKWLSALNAERSAKKLPKIYFHTDACQAAGALELDVNRIGVDLLSLNGSKIYGPKQTGLLYIRSGTPLRPLIFGGGQERNLRSGTENVSGIVGLAQALLLAQKDRAKEGKRQRALRDYFITELLKKIPRVVLNGPDERNGNNRGAAKPAARLPNNINISIPGVDGEALMLYLDSYNIAVSTGSACTTQSTDPSHVILALGQSAEQVAGSMRFTLGKDTKKTDLDYVLKITPGIVEELRRVG